MPLSYNKSTPLTLEGMAELFSPVLKNSFSVTNAVVICAVAGRAYVLPHIQVPPGRQVTLKSHPNNAAASLMLIDPSPTTCLQTIGAYPLARNEAISYSLEDTAILYVSATIAGSVLVISVEKDRR